MARAQDQQISNEEIEAKVEVLSTKLEILRVRYEQYFSGVEKTAPAFMRMEVARLVRELEQAKVKNTAIKFKIRQCIQKFTSFSTYWNRILREIEDGTYKRHVDKAKRNLAALESKTDTAAKPVEADAKKTQDVADEASAFLASLGLDSSRTSAQAEEKNKTQTSSVSQESPALAQGQSKRRPTIVQASNAENMAVSPAIRPAIVQPAATASQDGSVAAEGQRKRRPTIVQATTSNTENPAVKPAIRPAVVQPAASNVENAAVKPAIRPAIVQPAATVSHEVTVDAQGQRKRRPTIVQASNAENLAVSPAIRPAIVQPSTTQAVKPAIRPAVIQTSTQAAPAVSRPAAEPPKPAITPSAVNPAAARPGVVRPAINPAVKPAAPAASPLPKPGAMGNAANQGAPKPVLSGLPKLTLKK